MAEQVTVRGYRQGDREQCHHLWLELTEWHRQIYEDPRIGGEHPEKYFDEHLARVGRDNLWVAVRNAKVVGLIGLMTSNYGEFEIEPLIVSKTHRGKGVGTRLVKALIAEARRRGLHSLNIMPVVRNIDTIKFLYKMGFQNLGHIQLFIDFTDHKWKNGPTLFGCRFKF